MKDKLQGKYVKIAKKFIEPYTKDKNVIGITIGGGVSRGTGDIYSEIDVSFWVRDKKKSKFPPAKDDTNVNGVWFDFSVLQIDEEMKKDWDMNERWDASQNKILFQRGGIITKIFEKKAKFRKGERKKLLGGSGFKGYWCLSLAQVFEKRGDLKNAHMLVNQSLDSYVDYYFLKNNKFIPYYKWKYYYFNKLKKPSKKVKEAIYEAYKIKDYSAKELHKRLSLVKKEIIKGDLKEKEFYLYHQQNLQAIEEFTESLKNGIKYSNPFEKDEFEVIK